MIDAYNSERNLARLHVKITIIMYSIEVLQDIINECQNIQNIFKIDMNSHTNEYIDCCEKEQRKHTLLYSGYFGFKRK